MISSGLSNTVPVVQNLEPGMGKCAAMLGQSAALEPGMGKCAAMLGQSAGLEGAELLVPHTMLMNERMNCENHKTNYETIKMEYSSLQHELTRVQYELKNLQSDKQSEQEKVQLLFAELQGRLQETTRELEDLQMQVMTPQRLELLRLQVQQEMEAPVRERFLLLEQETEMYRAEYNKVRYDFTILKAHFDHQTNEHARVLEDRRIHYEAEIGRLEKDREDLVAHYEESDSLNDVKQAETLMKENVQLNVRLKGLQAEVAELQAQKESSAHQAESVQRIQNRQLTESQAALKNLEAERLSLRQHVEKLENELHLSHEENSLVSGKLHKAEREVSSLCSELDTLKYSHKMEMANVKLDCARAQEEIERERDALQSRIDDLQTEVEDVTAALERYKELLVETQRETAQRVQCAREEELRNFAALLEEKVELEHRLASVEHQRALLVASDHSLKEDLEERLSRVQQSEECANRELHNLRCKLQQQSSQAEELERQKAAFDDLQQQNQVLGVQLEKLTHSESDLKETNQRLQQVSETMKEELRAAQAQAENNQDEAERLMEHRQAKWFLEEHELQQREAELQHRYSHLKEKLPRAVVAQKKRSEQTESRERKLQQKIELLEAKIVELELEAGLYKKQVDEQSNVRRRLKKLQQRHDEFHQLLLSDPGSPLTPSATPLLSISSYSMSMDQPMDDCFSELYQKIDILANAEQQKLEKMESDSTSIRT